MIYGRERRLLRRELLNKRFHIARAVYEALGAKVYVINNTPDGVNINKDCGSTHIEGLQKYVLENGLNVGFAYDGDADRCLAVDEKGNVVNGDHIMYMCGKYLKEIGQLDGNTVVTTVMSNMGLYKALEAIDGLIEASKDAFVRGSNIYLRGLGTFKVEQRAAKTARDIRRGTTVQVPARNTVKFLPCDELKERLN